MYEHYWKLREKPFENDQNIGFFYRSREQDEALVRLVYGIRESKGCIVLTGEAGCGKSYLLSWLARQLGESRVKVAMMKNPSSDPLDLLRQIAQCFGIRNAHATKSELVASLEQYLGYYRERDVRAVLMIDDADTIENDRSFEELRLLLNLSLGGKPLLTLVLSGTNRLRTHVRRVPGLAQRVSVSYALPALGEEDSIRYVRHRIQKVAAETAIFDDRALADVYRSTRGVPRLINNICDLSLLFAAVERRPSVEVRHVARARDEIKEMQG